MRLRDSAVELSPTRETRNELDRFIEAFIPSGSKVPTAADPPKVLICTREGMKVVDASAHFLKSSTTSSVLCAFDEVNDFPVDF